MYRYNVNISIASLRGNIVLIFFFFGLLPKVMGSNAKEGTAPNSAIRADKKTINGDKKGKLARKAYLMQLFKGKRIAPTMVIELPNGKKVCHAVKTTSILDKKIFSFRVPEEYKTRGVSFTYLGTPTALEIFSLKGCIGNVATRLPTIEKINSLILKDTGLEDIRGYPVLWRIAILDIQNSPLVNISGLNKVTQIHALFLGNNPKLTDITGLQALKSIKYIGIKDRTQLANISIIRPRTPQLHILVEGYTRAIMPCFVGAIHDLIASYAREVTPLASLASNIGDIMVPTSAEGDEMYVLNRDGVFDIIDISDI